MKMVEVRARSGRRSRMLRKQERHVEHQAPGAPFRRQLFDSQVEFFCRRPDNTPALGDSAIPFGGVPLTTDI